MIGAGVNSVLSKLLKRAFREPRPASARNKGHVDPGTFTAVWLTRSLPRYFSRFHLPPSCRCMCLGFPSSHAHMLTYLSVYISLTLPPEFRDYGIEYALLIYSLGGSLWRVHNGRHTLSQVVAGIVSGGLGGLAWYAIWSAEWVQYTDGVVEFARSEYFFTSMLVLIVFGLAAFMFLMFWGYTITGKID